MSETLLIADGYELVLSYIPGNLLSFSIKLIFAGRDDIVIHNFRPVKIISKTNSKYVQTRTVDERDRNHTKTKIEKVEDPKLISELNIFWPCLRKKLTNTKFRIRQNKKHNCYNTLSDPQSFWRTAVDIGKEYVSPEGKYYLMDLLRELGFLSGRKKIFKYSKFVRRLRKRLNQHVDATFTDIPGSEYSILKEIILLFNKDLTKNTRRTKIDVGDEKKFVLDAKYASSENEAPEEQESRKEKQKFSVAPEEQQSGRKRKLSVEPEEQQSGRKRKRKNQA